MEFGTKLCLHNASDYKRVIEALQGGFRSRVSYTDYFFDFNNRTLTRKNAILRLRVPCVDTFSPTAARDGCDDAHSEGTYGATPSVKGFIESFNTPCGGARNYVRVTQPTTTPLDPSNAVELVYKSGNTVGDGDQVSFSVKVCDVAPDVTQRLLTCHGGGDADVLSILRDYADELGESGRHDAADRVAALREIVLQLQRITAEGPHTGSHRHACPEAKSQSVSQPSARSPVPRPRSASQSVVDVAHSLTPGDDAAWRMQLVGSYCTTRKVFAYERGKPAHAAAAPESLLLRVDRSLFTNAERYELETLPTTDPSATTDVKEELEGFLRTLHVKFTPASENKFVRYIISNAGLCAPVQEVQDVKLRLSSLEGYKEVRRNLQSANPFTGSPHPTSPNTATARPPWTLVPPKRPRSRSFSHRPPHGLRAFADDGASTSSAETEPERDETGPGVGEFHENFFFDGPHEELARVRGFLRLRRLNRGDTYELVLKSRQRFEEGRQESANCKTQLSKDIAELLLEDDPSVFLQRQHKQNAVAEVLWSSYGLRELRATVHFDTHRLTVAWWSAQCQRPSTPPHVSAAPPPDYPATPAQAALIPMTLNYLNSQQPGHAECVSPLVLHLDCTHYTLPAPFSAPSSQLSEPPGDAARERATGDGAGAYCCDMYELEVTNLITASPAQVMNELYAVLQEMGVEWTSGTESKLDHYYTLLHRRWPTPVIAHTP